MGTGTWATESGWAVPGANPHFQLGRPAAVPPPLTAAARRESVPGRRLPPERGACRFHPVTNDFKGLAPGDAWGDADVRRSDVRSHEQYVVASGVTRDGA